MRQWRSIAARIRIGARKQRAVPSPRSSAARYDRSIGFSPDGPQVIQLLDKAARFPFAVDDFPLQKIPCVCSVVDRRGVSFKYPIASVPDSIARRILGGKEALRVPGRAPTR